MTRRRTTTTLLLTTAGAATAAALTVGAVLPAATARTTPPPAAQAEAADRPGQLTTSELREAGERFYEPLNTGEVEIYDDLLAEDWASVPAEEGQELGPAGWKEEVSLGFRGTFPDLRVDLEALHVSRKDSVVTVRGTFSGTQQGEFLGVPASGQSIEFDFIDIHQVDPASGRITTTWHVENLFGAYQQALGTPEG